MFCIYKVVYVYVLQSVIKIFTGQSFSHFMIFLLSKNVVTQMDVSVEPNVVA